MPAEFEDPSIAAKEAQNIGRPEILRWAMLTAVFGAIISLLTPVLSLFGLLDPVQTFGPEGEGDGMFALHFISSVAPPFLFIGAGLATAATVEVRRALDPIEKGTIIRLWLTWGALAIIGIGMIFGLGSP